MAGLHAPKYRDGFYPGQGTRLIQLLQLEVNNTTTEDLNATKKNKDPLSEWTSK